ncbi:MAG: hypothetical protein BGO52_07585 [Sphingobacteriales bacterium 44-61]|nr:MAG: hypothetical protein BGO52_07585 [Sphingobacteriales bacterium 44-61]
MQQLLEMGASYFPEKQEAWYKLPSQHLKNRNSYCVRRNLRRLENLISIQPGPARILKSFQEDLFANVIER